MKRYIRFDDKSRASPYLEGESCSLVPTNPTMTGASRGLMGGQRRGLSRGFLLQGGMENCLTLLKGKTLPKAMATQESPESIILGLLVVLIFVAATTAATTTTTTTTTTTKVTKAYEWITRVTSQA